MNVTRLTRLFALVAVATTAVPANAAFIVETRTGGKAFANFSTGGDTGAASTSSASSTAAGMTAALGSIFGGNSATSDQYLFSYTPGTDADNTTYSAGQDLGAGNSASGIAGGGTGLYKVYATWPVTGNISSPTGDVNGTATNYVATSDGASAVADLFQDSDAGGLGSVWNLIGTVKLTAGQTYSVAQTAPNSLFVSMRGAGVMWEAVVPEPASCGLAAVAALGMIAIRRRS